MAEALRDVQTARETTATHAETMDYPTAFRIVEQALGIERAARRIHEIAADGTDYTKAMRVLAEQIEGQR